MKAKPVLIIVGSLLIGIVIGFLVSAQLRHRRMKPVRVLTSERYFREVLYNVIEPDDELKDRLEPIIEKYGKKGREMQIEYRRSFDTNAENYWKDIRKVLSAEQIQKLEEFREKMEEERKRFRPDSNRTRDGSWDRRRGHTRGGRPQWEGPDSLKHPIDSAKGAEIIN